MPSSWCSYSTKSATSVPAFVSLADQIFEIERELKVRQRVYARWMQTNKIKPEVAGQQVERMLAARDSLIALRAERARISMADPIVRVRIREGWEDAGRTGVMYHQTAFGLGQPWSMVLLDGDEDPDCHKSSGLQRLDEVAATATASRD